MPILEFYSPDTHKIYSFFARRSSEREKIPRCPDGESHRMERVLSRFAVTGRAKESEEGSAEAAEDPRLEAAMAEMEREMAGMDEDNPDPRKMGTLMRKMASLTGEKLPDSMEEMIGRLEAGEDPEALEEEFGDMPELDEFGEAMDDGGENSPTRQKLRGMRRPNRDPELYEMREYL